MPLQQKFPILVFADGASSGNPGPGGWGAIIVTPQGHVTELGARSHTTTNNKMELMAVISALYKLAHTKGEVHVFTDSTYVINGITKWIWSWRKRGWKTLEGKDVANTDLWKELFILISKRSATDKVSWKYVRGHTGIPGNERADEIAVQCSKGHRPGLYDGPLLRYDIAIHDLPEELETPVPSPKSRSKTQEKKAPPFSYLSLIGDAPMRHTTWAECERRVKGRSGAKFKKAMNESDETVILKSWGINKPLIKPKN